MMRFLHISIYMAVAIGICSALPIPSVQASDRNAFIIGALVFLSLGAALTGCVCCRRRKKGFELNHESDRKEFTNESGTQESVKNEYPIFRALSPESQRSNQPDPVGTDQRLANANSHENLIAEEADNNNGPISPLDLENIENNNAVDYIQNQNEINIVIEPSPQYTRDRNLDVAASSDFDEILVAPAVIQDVAISSTTSHDSVQSIHLLHVADGDGAANDNVNVLKATIAVDDSLEVPIPKEAKSAPEVVAKEQSMGMSVDEEPTAVKVDVDCLEMSLKREHEEPLSEKSEPSSEKTNEVSSVEEALRALDSAIEDAESGNEEDNDSDSDSLPEEGFSGHNLDLENVITDFLRGEQSKQADKSGETEEIRSQALELVEDILNESRLVAEKRADDCTFDVGHCGVTIEVDSAEDSPLDRVESFEDFFNKDILAKTSTPSVQSKFMVSTKTSTNKGGFSQQLFADTSVDSPPANATFDAGATFNMNDKTFDLDKDKDNEFTYPGDPCTSKQAIERDQRDDVNSEDLNTITPVNTPIELNYNQETWNRMTKQLDEDTKNGWFLHPQMNGDENVNETMDMPGEENEENLELTFEALRKQLAEVLPQPQGMAGPPEFSDDEDDANSNRTFDEYRSPLDGLFGLLEIDSNSPPKEPQNEMFINYKRSLSPIMEESEEETFCRTFAVNETKCLDNSTSTGCMETGEAIMGVTKTLMASNDTLFNFEDTLGDKEDVFSPRLSSKSNSLATTPVKSGNRSGNDSQATTITTSSETDKQEDAGVGKKMPPKTIEFVEASCFADNELCSPDQQKTFSEGTTTTSSTTDRMSSDISPTLDNEATFTTNTNDDNCVTVIIRDDERISEISEPDWGSSASYNNAAVEDTNSLADVPSLDFNVNNFEQEDTASQEHTIDLDHDDSGHSTQASTDGGKSNTSHNISAQETDSNEEHIHLTPERPAEPVQKQIKSHTNRKCNSKENHDPNVPSNNSLLGDSPYFSSSANQKVQINSQDAVIIDKSKTNSVSTALELADGDCEEAAGHLNDKFAFYQPIAYYQADASECVSNCMSVVPNVEFGLAAGCGGYSFKAHLVAAEYLSGEEDPWASPLPDSAPASTDTSPEDEVVGADSEANEWESDIDDSHDSSEEFMYVRGTAVDGDIRSLSPSDDNLEKQSDEEALNSNDLWSSHDDQIRVKVEAKEDVSDDSSSEGEFVPSCWNSNAIPARSAMKSPDKSSSDTKKRRSVVFKNQRYFSVYEYPKENVLISPSYSDSNLWKKVRDDFATNAHTGKSDIFEDLSDGFTVSSSTRPFHGSQFNVFCHTWPTDADFSWSQESAENRLDENKPFATYSDIDLKWSDKYPDFDGKKDEEMRNEDVKRPDSGVGESAETLLDRPSSSTIGELCHTKATLRLPIEGYSPPSAADTSKSSKIEISEHRRLFPEEVVLPTPSCTGSMDSLNSTSSSERQLSFSTFSKPNSYDTKNSSNQNSNHTSCSDSFNAYSHGTRPAINIILYEDDRLPAGGEEGDKVKQSDSTDEDSGIESIMRIGK